MTFWDKVCNEMKRITNDDPEVIDSINWIDKKVKSLKDKFKS